MANLRTGISQNKILCAFDDDDQFASQSAATAAPILLTSDATASKGPALNMQTPNQYWVAGATSSFALAATTFTDAAGLAMTYSATLSTGAALPTWLKFTGATATFSGIDPAGTAPVTVRVTATDTAGLAASESFTISLAAAPKLTAQTGTQYLVAGKASSFTLASGTFTDPQGAALSYTATTAAGASLPAWLSFNAANRTFTGTDPAGTAPLALKVTATDTYGLATAETFNVTLATAPVIAAQTATQYWLAGKASSFTLAAGTFTDPQGSALTYAATLATGASLPSWLSFNVASRTFSGTDPAGTAAVAVKVTATDSYGLSVAESFSIALATAPVVTVQTAPQYWVAGKATTLTLPAGTFTDPQGLAMAYTATLAGGAALPTWLKFTAATASFSGTDVAGTAPISVTVTAKDSAGATGSENFSITLAAAPTLANQTAAQTWTQGTAVSFTLPTGIFVDPQGAAITYSAALAGGAALPSWLSFNAATGTFTGTPPAGGAGLTLQVTGTDSYGLAATETFAVSTPAASAIAPAGPFVINVTYDATVAAAPAGFKTAVAAAVTYLQNEFTNPSTLNITIGFGSVNGSPIAAGALGQSQTSFDVVSYSTLLAALQSTAVQPDQIAAAASLPAVSPVGAANFLVSNGLAKALGLGVGVVGVNDGYVGLSSAFAMTYDPANRAVAGSYDAVGIIEHEITEIMGRTGLLGSIGGYYTPLDLFRYTSPGVRDLIPGAGSFSIDGITMLQAFNNPLLGGDTADWATTVTGDAFGTATAGVAQLVTAVDLRAMNALGYARASLTS